MISGHEERPRGVRHLDTVGNVDSLPRCEWPERDHTLERNHTIVSVGVSHDKTGRHVVSEVCSPPRITLEIKKGKNRNLAPGIAMDLTVNDADDFRPWDFSLKSKRD